jgi:hypothetical protein
LLGLDLGIKETPLKFININTTFVLVDGQKRNPNLMRRGTLKKRSHNTTLNKDAEKSERRIFQILFILLKECTQRVLERNLAKDVLKRNGHLLVYKRVWDCVPSGHLSNVLSHPAPAVEHDEQPTVDGRLTIMELWNGDCVKIHAPLPSPSSRMFLKPL